MKNNLFLIYLAVMFWLPTQKSICQNFPQLGKASIEEVISAMTLEEKAALVVGTGLKFGDEIDNNSPYKIPNQPLPGSLASKTKVHVVGAIGRTLEIPRLGITTLEMVDGPAGVSFGSRATAFPIATSIASSWDEKLVYQVGEAMGDETEAYGFDLLLAPAINIHRNPLGGRNFEYFSEDPIVSGKMGAALIKGIQSQDVGTSLKHFVANNQETNRIEVDVNVSERALREIYLRGFEIAVKESDPWTLMGSYNSINGSLATENHDLLTTIARKEWNYEGIIISDWEAGLDPIKQMKAGLNLIMPGPYKSEELIQAVLQGKLSEEILDDNIAWILKGVMKGQKFKNKVYSNSPDFEKNTAIARKAAAEGMILLKNENQALPLINKEIKLALFGNGSYETIIGGSGSGFVMSAGETVQMVAGIQSKGLTISEELLFKYESYLKENTPKQNSLDLARGRKIYAPEMKLDLSLINEIANETDHAIITISRISGETTDRTLTDNFELSEVERVNIENVTKVFHKKGKLVTVVLNIGGVIETASWKALPDAILIVWQPGQEAGNAISDVLRGDVNPSGKLTTSFPISYSDEPSSKNFPGSPVDKPKAVIYEEGIYVGYRYFQSYGVRTSFPFGFGLSYTSFEYSDLKLSSSFFKDELELSLVITNIGKVPGKEVVQIYVSAPPSALDKPTMELKAFSKTGLLLPGQSETIKLKLDARSLTSYYTNQSAWIIDPGEYQILIGSSSDEIKLKNSLMVKEMILVEKTEKALAPIKIIPEFHGK